MSLWNNKFKQNNSKKGLTSFTCPQKFYNEGGKPVRSRIFSKWIPALVYLEWSRKVGMTVKITAVTQNAL